jgi:hypothetical protein
VPANQSDVVEFRLGDIVNLRKAHPCGSHEWLVDRLGADIGVRCRGCGRHVLLERRAMERRLTGFVERGDLEMSLAVAPHARDVVAAAGPAGASTAASEASSESSR